MKRMDFVNKSWILFFSVFLVPICILASPSAYALGISVSQAELNWSGLSFTTDGSLVINKIETGHFNSSSGAFTMLGSPAQDSKDSSSNPLGWSNTAAASSFSNVNGNANAEASTKDGLLIARSRAETTLQSAVTHKGEANASTSKVFWLYGTGSGAVTVSAPYSLSLFFQEAQPEGTSNVFDFTTGSASVSLMMGPGAGWYASDALSRPDAPSSPAGNLAKTGILTLSRDFDNPEWDLWWESGRRRAPAPWLPSSPRLPAWSWSYPA